VEGSRIKENGGGLVGREEEEREVEGGGERDEGKK